MSEDKVKVLYIGGYSRSGSTLLLRLLGQLDGFVSVGEVWDIWNRSFVENQLCGCGQPFRNCEFWQAVVDEAFGGFHMVDVNVLQSLRSSVQSNQHIPFLALPFLRPPGYHARLKVYTDVLRKLYCGIHQVTGGQVIVDSSKVPPYAFLLNQIDDIDLHIVHLVRDSRATAYSWQRKKVRPEIHWKTSYMDQYSPLRSAIEWNVMNGLLHSLKLSGSNYMRMRYEELVDQPREAILRIMQNLGQELQDIQFFDDEHAVHLRIDHTVSGNPNRFQQGAVRIKADNEWREKMPESQKRLVTTLTLPLLLNYGYLQADHSLRNGHTVNGNHHKDHREEVETGQKVSLENGAKSKCLRILLVTARYLPYVGGTEVHTYEVARRLAAAGNEVTVLTASPDLRRITHESSDGIQVIRVPAWPNGHDYYFAPAMYSIVKNGQWDILHCQGYHTFVAPLVMLAATQAKIPYVVTFHSGGHSSPLRNALRPIQRSLLRPLLAGASQLISVSKWEAEFFKQHLRLPEDRFSVIPNGSYLPRVQSISSQQNNGRVIVSVGRLERYKGHHRVISALPLVLREYPDVRLRIVGSGPYEDSLRKLAYYLGISERVEIKAVQGSDRESMASVLMGASLVILLSNYESQGISAMEGLALGRPVLVADSTALHELTANGLARGTSLGSTPDEVAEAIIGQLRQPLIPASATLPTWEACASQLMSLYRKIIFETS